MCSRNSGSKNKASVIPGILVDGKPVCPGCRMRDQAVIVSYGLAVEQEKIKGSMVQLALEDYLGETIPPGKYKFIAKCNRCGIRFVYTKDLK